MMSENRPYKYVRLVSNHTTVIHSSDSEHVAFAVGFTQTCLKLMKPISNLLYTLYAGSRNPHTSM
jgi:hypothetical protein